MLSNVAGSQVTAAGTPSLLVQVPAEHTAGRVQAEQRVQGGEGALCARGKQPGQGGHRCVVKVAGSHKATRIIVPETPREKCKGHRASALSSVRQRHSVSCASAAGDAATKPQAAHGGPRGSLYVPPGRVLPMSPFPCSLPEKQHFKSVKHESGSFPLIREPVATKKRPPPGGAARGQATPSGRRHQEGQAQRDLVTAAGV